MEKIYKVTCKTTEFGKEIAKVIASSEEEAISHFIKSFNYQHTQVVIKAKYYSDYIPS